MLQWLGLSPHSKEVLGTNCWLGLSVCSFNMLPASVEVFSVYSVQTRERETKIIDIEGTRDTILGLNL